MFAVGGGKIGIIQCGDGEGRLWFDSDLELVVVDRRDGGFEIERALDLSCGEVGLGGDHGFGKPQLGICRIPQLCLSERVLDLFFLRIADARCEGKAQPICATMRLDMRQLLCGKLCSDVIASCDSEIVFHAVGIWLLWRFDDCVID